MDDDAAARARRARGVEELRRLSKIADQADGTEAVSHISTGAESDDKECNHFSLRGYVAMLQKKDPTLRSHLFRNQPQYDEHHDSSPVLASKHLRWNYSKCLDRLKLSGHRPTTENVSMQRDGMNNGCSIRRRTHPSIHPSIQNVDPPYPASPPAEETRSEVASNF